MVDSQWVVVGFVFCFAQFLRGLCFVFCSVFLIVLFCLCCSVCAVLLVLFCLCCFACVVLIGVV